MSKITIALEAAVATVLENTPRADEKASARQRLNVDRAFAQILKLIAPRIRHFIRQYGLTAHWDDAEQCCAIAVHRAIQAYEPDKAQFTTFVNWQIRGELQSLRFRLMTDQRPSAKKVDATTVSLHSVAVGAEGEETTLESLIVDQEALALTEASASAYLAKAATASLIDEYVRANRNAGLEQLRRQQPKRQLAKLRTEGPRFRTATSGLNPEDVRKLDENLARDREILERRVFGDGTSDDLGGDTGITKERIRQIGKRAAKSMAELATSHPRFRVMAESGGSVTPRLKPVLAAQNGVSLLPDPSSMANQENRVVAVHAGAELTLSDAALEAENVPAIDPASLPVNAGGQANLAA